MPLHKQLFFFNTLNQLLIQTNPTTWNQSWPIREVVPNQHHTWSTSHKINISPNQHLTNNKTPYQQYPISTIPDINITPYRYYTISTSHHINITPNQHHTITIYTISTSHHSQEPHTPHFQSIIPCPQGWNSGRGEGPGSPGYWHQGVLITIPGLIILVLAWSLQCHPSLDSSPTSEPHLWTSLLNLSSEPHLSQSIMSDLKTHLYAKFGDAINLESDDWSWRSRWSLIRALEDQDNGRQDHASLDYCLNPIIVYFYRLIILSYSCLYNDYKSSLVSSIQHKTIRSSDLFNCSCSPAPILVGRVWSTGPPCLADWLRDTARIVHD